MIAKLPILRSIAILAMASAALAAEPPKAAPKPAPKAAPTAAPPTHKAKWEDFRILTDRNIFDRNRRPQTVHVARTEPPRGQYTPPPPKPIDTDQYFVLLGIGLEGPQYTAFFEDSKAGKIIQVSPGDTVGRGRLGAVNLDSVQYDRDGKSRVVKVGYTLTGLQASSMVFAAPASITGTAGAGSSQTATPPPTPTGATPTTGPATTQPTTAPPAGVAPPPAPNENQDIIERMRQRRLQELGR